jgi:uncharacterized repeat protein (TIGR01451 family)
LTLSKSADKAVVGIGEFVPYTLTIANNSATKAVTSGLIADHPPPGFRYRQGSARLNGAVIADPLIAPDAGTLNFTLNIAAGALAKLRYVLEVTSAAHAGVAENSAVASAGFSSNTARASVLVREDLFRNKAILIGRVIDGSCDDKSDLPVKGLANARVVLQDGSYVLTDKEGNWHIDNLRAGTHVDQRLKSCHCAVGRIRPARQSQPNIAARVQRTDPNLSSCGAPDSLSGVCRAECCPCHR